MERWSRPCGCYTVKVAKAAQAAEDAAEIEKLNRELAGSRGTWKRSLKE